jgi:hypothetical protein
MFQKRVYKGQVLIARKEGGHWRVSMDDGYKTGLHPSAQGAFDEAEKWIDAKNIRTR